MGVGTAVDDGAGVVLGTAIDGATGFSVVVVVVLMRSDTAPLWTGGRRKTRAARMLARTTSVARKASQTLGRARAWATAAAEGGQGTLACTATATASMAGSCTSIIVVGRSKRGRQANRPLSPPA